MSGSPERARLDSEAMGFVLAAGRARMLRDLQRGATLEQATNVTIESQDLLHQYLEQFPEQGRTLSEHLGIDRDSIVLMLGQTPFALEAQPVLKPDESVSNSPAAMSQPTREAMKLSRSECERVGRTSVDTHALIASLLAVDSNARSFLLDRGAPSEKVASLDEVLSRGDTTQSDPLAGMMADMRKLMDAAWPQILKEQDTSLGMSKLEELKSKEFESKPQRYEESLNLAEELAKPPQDPAHAFMEKAGVCLHAAENEARIRKAPQVELDHLFLALLQDGTDTSAFLDRLGADRAALRETLDRELPRYEEGPRFPHQSRALAYCIPSNQTSRYRQLGVGARDTMGMPEEEMREMFRLVEIEGLVFTDLMWLTGACAEEETFAGQTLRALRVTKEVVEGEIRELGR